MYKFLLFALPLTLATVAQAMDPENMIKYRQAAMKAVGGHNGALKQIERDRVEVPGAKARHAAAIDALFGELEIMFIEGSDFGETEALEKIWEQPEQFAEAIRKAQAASKAYMEAVAANPGDTAAAYKELGASCKGCHKEFRKKKEK